MKKNFLKLSVLVLLFTVSCQKDNAPKEETGNSLTGIVERNCASNEVLQAQLAEDPARRERMNAIEAFTRQYINNEALKGPTAPATTTLTIPVIVHVLYNTEGQNISDAQVASQLEVLNEDFNLLNKDHTKVPDTFASVKANVEIKFTLAETKRVPTAKRSFGTDDGIKYTRRGGSDAVEPGKYLNIWVGNLGQNLLGYAQFPGGNPATDGIVVLYSAFGSRAKVPGGTYVNNYDLGRTATHEVGHWMNLRHIWGDATCGNDYVGDTPPHNTSNGGCPTSDHRSTCAGTPLEMWMNYMDYTYDGCMYMFSTGQKDRMRAIFSPGGIRASFAL